MVALLVVEGTRPEAVVVVTKVATSAITSSRWDTRLATSSAAVLRLVRVEAAFPTTTDVDNRISWARPRLTEPARLSNLPRLTTCLGWVISSTLNTCRHTITLLRPTWASRCPRMYETSPFSQSSTGLLSYTIAASASSSICSRVNDPMTTRTRLLVKCQEDQQLNRAGPKLGILRVTTATPIELIVWEVKSLIVKKLATRKCPRLLSSRLLSHSHIRHRHFHLCPMGSS